MLNHAYPQTIFVLGTSRDIGKTVTCVGIIASLLSQEHGYKLDEIGYMKPVGQQTLTVLSGEGVPIQADKDAVLITSLMGIQGHGYEKTSPVVWKGGVTAKFIDDAAKGDPRADSESFMERIREAYRDVSLGKRIVLVEGTGQPGVGSVAGISNADVINGLREMGVPVTVLMVTGGGIGSTIDQVFPYLMTLEHLGTRVDGLIINDVIPSKVDKIKHYLNTYYGNVFADLYGHRMTTNSQPRIVGFVPTITELRLPTMRLIAEALSKRDADQVEVLAPNDFDQTAIELVRHVRVISLDYGYERFVQPGDAVIIGVNANDTILSLLNTHKRLINEKGTGLSGMLLSCRDVGGLSDQVRDLVRTSDLPTLAVGFDSADIIKRIDNMTIKIQPYDVHKRDLIAAAYEEHLDLWLAQI